MKLFSKKKKVQAYLGLDIGSSSVKAVIFKLENEKIIVLGFGERVQDSKVMYEGLIKDVHQVSTNCDLAITQAALQSGIRPSETVMGVSGEQVKGFTTIVQFERSNPEAKISEKEMVNIITKVQETAYRNSLKKYREELGNQDLEIKLVNAALTHIIIDGERVEEPLGFRGRKIQVGVYNAYAPLVQLSNLQKIASELGLELMAIAAEPYALAETVIASHEKHFEALLIDVGGSTTDVVLIKDQDVLVTKMFGIGVDCVREEISRAFDISESEAEKLKRKYILKELEEEKQVKKIATAIAEGLDSWQMALEVVLEEISESDPLPANILLTGGGTNLPEVKEIVQKLTKSKSLAFGKTVTVELLLPQDLNLVIDQTGNLESPQSVVSLCLGTIMLDLQNEDQFNGAMKSGVHLFEK